MKLLFLFMLSSFLCLGQKLTFKEKKTAKKEIKNSTKDINTYPDRWKSYAIRAYFNLRLGNNHVVIQDCDIVIANCTRCTSILDDLYDYKAKAYFNLKDYNKAIANFKKSIQYLKEDYEKALTYVNIGNAYINLGNIKHGCFYFSRADELGEERGYDALTDYCE